MNAPVRLQVKINDRFSHHKVPNRVSFYDIPLSGGGMHGAWRTQALVEWIDSTSFLIDIPGQTVINLKDVSRGLTKGTVSPGVFATVAYQGRVDTVMTGDYQSVTDRFKFKPAVFSEPIYYYDIERE
jgi:hypothetical protein